MRKSLASLTFAVAVLGLTASQAFATPFVADNSQYTVYLEGSSSHNAVLALTTFDGQPETLGRAGLTLTFNESETATGASSSHITLTVSANGDLFPVDQEGAFLGIGLDGTGLNLLAPVNLTDARLTIQDESGNTLFASDNLAGDVLQPSPWNGIFLGVNDAIGIGGIGGQDAASITFDFYVSAQQEQTDVPEPASLLLCGLGLAGLGAARRRSASRAA